MSDDDNQIRFVTLSVALSSACKSGYKWARLGDYGGDSEDTITVLKYVSIIELISNLKTESAFSQLNDGKEWQYLSFCGGHAIFKTLGRKKITLFKSLEKVYEEMNEKKTRHLSKNNKYNLNKRSGLIVV